MDKMTNSSEVCSNCRKTKEEHHYEGLFCDINTDNFNRFTPQKTNTQSQQPEVLTCQGGREFIGGKTSLHSEIGKSEEYLPADIRAPQTSPTLKDKIKEERARIKRGYIEKATKVIPHINASLNNVEEDIKESLKRLRDEIRKLNIWYAESDYKTCLKKIDEIMGDWSE